MNDSNSILHRRFELQVEVTPDAGAVTFDGETLSYNELNRRANRVAHYLLGLGLEKGQLVGLCLDRSIDTIVSILAVLKAGGAYVPMDPLYPTERVRMIVEDAQCPMVLVHEAYADRFTHSDDSQIVVLDGAVQPWSNGDDLNTNIEATGMSLAYVIYTSGSTGKPKGALINHYNVARLFTAMEPEFGFGKDDVWTMFHSYAFDFSVWEMWGALFFGGRLVVVPHLVCRAPETFHQLLIDEHITVLSQTPSAFKQLQFYDETLPLEISHQLSLRYVLIGGEFMDLPGLAPWYERHSEGAPRLVHVYGITETTVFVTYRFLFRVDTMPGTPSLIGKAIADLVLYVLDDSGNPVAVGDVGELHVGGPGVCKGYLKRPELTAERFVDNPFEEREIAPLLYKTGDLVRLLENDLEFIGRNDMQVQLRGFRVELGEIESELNAHAEIRGAVVRLREDNPGDQRLVAYYLAQEAQAPALLREHLLQTLPAYMVPARFVHLDVFPLNNNGKIDMGALPIPEVEGSAVDYAAPQTPCEKSLVAIWESLLRISPVGVNDSFFDLGGHSLLATQLILRVEQEFRVRLPLGVLLETPTIAAHSRVIQEAIAAGTTSAATEPLPEAKGPIPLAFSQERLWIIEQLYPGNTAYNIPLYFAISGPVNLYFLKQAFDAVVERHQVLRTYIEAGAERPEQSIRPRLDVPFEYVDSCENEGGEGFRGLLQEVAGEFMPLDRGPLIRVLVQKVNDSTCHFGLVIHHALFDGWSISVFLDDLSASYTQLCQGGDGALAPLRPQFADYAVWQRARVESEGVTAQLAYWKSLLVAPLAVLDLPTDYPRPPVQGWEGRVANGQIPARAAQAIKTLAVGQQKTLFTVLLAAWKILLHRYTNESDILVGSVVAGRNRQDVEGLIGFFVNTVVLRSHVTPEISFPEFLVQIESVSVGAQENQEVPFERVVAAVQKERDPSRPPLCQVFFVLHNTPPYATSLGEARIAGEETGNGSAKFDLTLAIQTREDVFQLSLEYNTSLFRPETAKRILTHYQTLLDSICVTPEAKLGDLSMLPPDELSQLLRVAVGPAHPLDRSLSIVGIFESHSQENPAAIAVVDDQASLSYRELDQRANQVAQLLVAQGVKRGDPVPFFLPRTAHTLVAMLGVMKAGGAYVPLDLQDPPARRERVLTALDAPFVLTEKQSLSALSSSSVTTYCLDDSTVWSAISNEATGIPLAGDDLAYIIFTSGSTGEPKGVCCNHLGVINLFQDLQARQAVGPGDPCSIWAAFSFDASVYETWTGILAGAALYIVPEEVRLRPETCLPWMAKMKIAAGYLPGYMLNALQDFQREGGIPLRRLMAGVEPLRESVLADIVSHTPGLVFVNAYGPTEATVYATLYPVPVSDPPREGNAPIGRPIANTRVYVLDESQRLAPRGVPGELCIGGIGLARGYYNDEALTAAQFVPDPFSEHAGDRLYRSGDLAYLDAEDNLRFVRRMGRYIKLRGLRIEPGEIESVLRALPSVDDAVVVLWGEVGIHERLIAYVVPAAGETMLDVDLLAHLTEALPVHMRPSQFVYLDALPRTVQGKLDRPVLPEPPPLLASEDMVGARTAIERALVGLWERELGVEKVGIRDNFFSLGGHSMAAIQMATQISVQFDVDIVLRDLLDNATIAGLAALIERYQRESGVRESSGQRMFVLKEGIGEPFFCVTGAGDVMGSYGPLASSLGDEQPFFGYSEHLLDLSDEDEYEVESTAAAFIREIRARKPHGPYLLGGYSFGGILAFEAARQLMEDGEVVAGVFMLDASAYQEGVERAHVNLLAMRFWCRRIFVRLWMFLYTWKHQIGYVRDGLKIVFERVLRGRSEGPDAPGFGEYLRWIWQDTGNRYFLVQGKLATPRIADKRLEMIRESWVRRTTRRVGIVSASRRNYHLKSSPIKVTLLRVAHDPWKEATIDPTLGWKHFAEKGVDVRVVPGNHMVMNREPYVRDLGAILQDCLDEAIRDVT